MHPSLPLLVVSPTAGFLVAFLLGNSLFLGGDDDLAIDVPRTAESLRAAVKEHDVATVEWLLGKDVQVDAVDELGRTALMQAIEQKDPGMAQVLLEGGADPRAVDAEGGTVLYHAIRRGEVSVVKTLLERGADADGTTSEGGGLFAYAVAEGRTASAQLLLNAGASQLGGAADGRPVVIHAAERMADWLLERILEMGGDVDARDERGETVMHAIARGGESECLPLVWRFGADVNATNGQGVAPLHLAVAAGATKLVGDLGRRGAAVGFPHPEEGAPVLMALELDDVGVLRELLELGADAEVSGRDGRTAMEVAVDRRNFEAARLLADHGGGVDGLLYDAVVAGDGELVRFLLSEGAKANGEESALVAAVRGEDEAISVALLQSGATVPEGKVWAGQSLFHLAMARGQVEVVRLLLQQGAKVNEAFAEPVKDEFLEVVKSEGKIRWFLKKDRRVTPLMMGADRGDLELVRLLMEYGANTDTSTRRHRFWPINFASQRDDVPMMQLMLGGDPEHEERWVKVDLSEQKAWVYGMDDEVLLETRVSTGKKGYRTRTGTFVVSNKYRSWTSTIYKGASMPYFQRLSCGDFGFHQGYVPSYPASHGCLRVPSGNASKLFKLTRVGDRVEIVE